MGKPTGFFEYKSQLPADRAPLERIADWQEFHNPMAEEDLQRQASRCMECGIPFCLNGEMIAGMVSGCPLHNLMPEWNDLVYHGLWHEALSRLLKTNNFPEFTGRVCPAPCQGACTAGLSTEAVTIKNIECTIIDRAWEEGWIKPQPPAVRTGKKVAVVGSGPSGLACAAQLNRAGHSVTVYEREDRPGGLLMYGIPNMKLDKKNVVERRVQLMKDEGIIFVNGVEVGRDITAGNLRDQFDAVMLCCGAAAPRDLVVEGRRLQGVHFAMEYLKANTKSLLDSQLQDGRFISAAGKDVVVIGGGDTGTDCVGTAIRHGARSVCQLEIMPRLPEQRGENNPWPQFPRVLKTDYGQEEATAKFGADPRQYCVTAKQFLSDAQGAVKAVDTVMVKWVKNERGQMIPREIPGTETIRPAQLVLLAMGFVGPEKTIPEQLGLALDARTNVRTENGGYATNIPGVFAAGDMRRGQSLVVWAISEGRAAARECDLYLMGDTNLK